METVRRTAAGATGTTGTTDEPAGTEVTPVETVYAECVLCRKPTEYLESVKGATLCPVCEWQEAQRMACSG